VDNQKHASGYSINWWR